MFLLSKGMAGSCRGREPVAMTMKSALKSSSWPCCVATRIVCASWNDAVPWTISTSLRSSWLVMIASSFLITWSLRAIKSLIVKLFFSDTDMLVKERSLAPCR